MTSKRNCHLSSNEEEDEITDQGQINVQEALRKMRHDIFVMQRTMKLISGRVVLDEQCHS